MRLYLDFDGVINVFRDRKSDPWVHATGWNKHEKTKLFGGRERYVIHYAPELTESIQKLAEEGVEIVWISTWQQYTDTFPRIGLPHAPWIQFSHNEEFSGISPKQEYFRVNMYDDATKKRADFSTIFGIGKGAALFTHLEQNPTDIAVWVDDDLSIECFDYADNFDNLTLFKTVSERGITKGLWGKIVETLSNGVPNVD